ncbi:methyltransferase domain-containing protein [bacterium]|nr:methyltransferase domain-containing protein [bacterium]
MSSALAQKPVESRNLNQAVQQSLGISHGNIYKKVMDVIKTYGPENGQLLDFGAGQGDFLKNMKRAAFQFMYHGVDLMYSKVEGVNWYVQDLNKKLQFKDGQFDVVTCIEVIEHLENPRKIIRELSRALKPEGLLVITTPNNESWRSIISYIFRGHFVSFTETSYPAHITALNQTDLYRILQECGFTRMEVVYTDVGMVPSLPQYTWQKISFGFLKGLRFSDNIVVVAQR